MGFDLGHMINSLAKLALRAKRVADKNKAEEQNVEEEVRKKFFEWLDWVLSSKNIDKAVAFNFNIYEDGESIWSLELVGTSEFSATDSDWACAELFATRSHPFKITYSGSWKEVLALFKKFVNSYLETGARREVLKAKAGVGIGFVDGDLELLYQKEQPKKSGEETRDAQADSDKTAPDKFQPFWSTMELCDWGKKGDDEKVLEPVIQYLSKQNDDVIFKFDDLMSELLYRLDTKELAAQCQEEEPQMGDDSFLYSRCVALINGPAYYEKVKQGNEKGVWQMEFEALLYVPGKAWALKHQSSVDAYTHSTPFSYETGSNKDGWGGSKLTDRSFGVKVYLGRDQIIRLVPCPENKCGVFVHLPQGREVPLSHGAYEIGKAYLKTAEEAVEFDGENLVLAAAAPIFKTFKGFKSQKAFNTTQQYIWSYADEGNIYFTFLIWHDGEFALYKGDIKCEKIISDDSDAAAIGQTILDVFNMADSAYPEKHIWGTQTEQL